MNLPQNGRVIIIDDKPTQAFPLIAALSKFNISTLYFDARKETLPDKKKEDVRVVFLDINLNDGPATWENEKSTLITYISAIIAPKIPYILFIWSVNERTHLGDVSKLFEEELLDYKPLVAPIPMQKDMIFDLVDPETDKWELKDGIDATLKVINSKIEDGLSRIDAFEPLVIWENIVGESSSAVVNDIFNLAKLSPDANKGLKDIYFNLAHAYWGKSLAGQTCETIIPKSLINLNSILSDKIEHVLINIFKSKTLADFPTRAAIEPRIRAEINTRLLLSEDTVNLALPGNLYVLDNPEYKKEIIESLLDRSTFVPDYCKENDIELKDVYEANTIRQDHKKPFEKFGYKKVTEVITDALYIQIELTPICDYSQGNRLFCRMVSGVILDEKYRANQKRSATYFYTSPTFLLDGKIVNFYCDFRYILSVNESDFKDKKPTFRIRHLFQSDIQSQLARQVSRPGIVSL